MGNSSSTGIGISLEGVVESSAETGSGNLTPERAWMNAGSAMTSTTKYTISSADGMTHVRFHENPTIDDLKAAADEIVAGHPHERRLWDFRDVSYRFSMVELNAISSYGKHKLPQPSRVAILVSDDLAFGIGRQYEVSRSVPKHTQVRVFRDEQAALMWLYSSDE